MTYTKLSTKGQLVLPKEVRERHGWAPGTAFEIEDQGSCIVLRPAPFVAEVSLDELFGCAGYGGPPKSLEEMDEAIAEGARQRP
ncbi:MAG: AbrB/MazE/SpoVT family DNA-binding domain-containing protein [Deltaproteobacteria bacterium]|nr:AbrB/MazE/SpoVT family DNA-binding domain-containing protein [Deltaproteobacteria bacterium]